MMLLSMFTLYFCVGTNVIENVMQGGVVINKYSLGIHLADAI